MNKLIPDLYNSRPLVGTRSDEAAHLFWTGKYPLFDMGRALTSHGPSLSGKTAVGRHSNLGLENVNDKKKNCQKIYIYA